MHKPTSHENLPRGISLLQKHMDKRILWIGKIWYKPHDRMDHILLELNQWSILISLVEISRGLICEEMGEISYIVVKHVFCEMIVLVIIFCDLFPPK